MHIKFKVLGKSWTLITLDKKSYKKKKSHQNSVAVTKYHKRQVILSPKGRDLESICHELTHAYLYELCVHSADLNAYELEEVFAELLSKHGYALLDLATRLESQITGVS